MLRLLCLFVVLFDSGELSGDFSPLGDALAVLEREYLGALVAAALPPGGESGSSTVALFVVSVREERLGGSDDGSVFGGISIFYTISL
jgi:hypothetical protein